MVGCKPSEAEAVHMANGDAPARPRHLGCMGKEANVANFSYVTFKAGLIKQIADRRPEIPDCRPMGSHAAGCSVHGCQGG